MEETCSVTGDEFAVLRGGDELLGIEAINTSTIDVVITGRRQSISRASIEALQQALLSFLDTGTFTGEGEESVLSSGSYGQPI